MLFSSLSSVFFAFSCGRRKNIEQAKELLALCVQQCPQLNIYTLSFLLGYGTFGIVIQAFSPSGEKVAIKIMKKSQIHSSRLCVDPRTGQTTSLEIALLKYAPAHQNLIRYLDSWDDDECWYLVTNLGGELLFHFYVILFFPDSYVLTV